MQERMNEQVRETITKYLGDMHSLVDHGLKAVGRQADELKKEGHPNTLRHVREMKSTLEQHTNMITARLKELGGSPTHPVKDAVSAVAGLVAGLYNEVRTEQASKSMRDNYTFFSLVSMSYLMLHTTAAGLGDRQTAQLAERGYKDAARMVMVVNRHMPELVVHELQQDKLPVTDVTEECHRLVQEAWQQAQTPGLGTTTGNQPFAS